MLGVLWEDAKGCEPDKKTNRDATALIIRPFVLMTHTNNRQALTSQHLPNGWSH